MKNDQDDKDETKDIEVCPECHTLRVNGECMCDFW